MAEIVIAEFMSESAVAEGLAGRDVLFDKGLVDAPDRLIAALADARALIVRNRTQVTSALLENAPNLEAVGRLGVGLDNIDLEACAARNIKVLPATGANDRSVAEYVIAAAMMLVRGAYLSSASVAAGEWPRSQLMGGEIAGRCLGLIGYGAIAQETAGLAKGLGMAVSAYDPYRPEDDPCWTTATRCDLPTLLASADVVSLHTPLTEQTRHLINAEAIQQMQKSAVLINAARGGVVDEDALAKALHAGEIAGGALDVFEEEPLSKATGARFDGLSNIILTPHIGGVTIESNERVSQVTIENVLRVLDA